MSRIAVLGEGPRIEVWALAGALVVAADGPDDVRTAWDGLPDDVEVVIATTAAADALHDRRGGRLLVVLP